MTASHDNDRLIDAVREQVTPLRTSFERSARGLVQPKPLNLHGNNSSASSAPSSRPTSPFSSRHTSPNGSESRISSYSRHFALQPTATQDRRAGSASNATRTSSPQYHAATASRDISTQKINETPLHWPIPPRLQSPPPIAVSSRVMAQTSRHGATSPDLATSPSRLSALNRSYSEESVRKADPQSQSSVSFSGRVANGKSILETVQENLADGQEVIVTIPTHLNSGESTSGHAPESAVRTVELDKGLISGSDSGENRSDCDRGRLQSTEAKPMNAASQAHSSTRPHSLSTIIPKVRQADHRSGMTVETETVTSIPQTALSAADRRIDAGGTVRLKASNETIRPKRDRRRLHHKPRSIAQSTVSSKADIFEARVASAVDAHSSDSDDTFVYESNPPETQRTRRHHSRTPSVNSVHGNVDHRSTIRVSTEFSERKIAGKRSMKFSNHHDQDPYDGASGNVRSYRPRRLRGAKDDNTPFLLDHEQNILQGVKSRKLSKPDSARNSHVPQAHAKEAEHAYEHDGAIADDERTPLIGLGMRSQRSSRVARANHSDSGQEYQSLSVQNHKSWKGTIRGTCIAIGLITGAVIFAIIILTAWNRPIYDVKIRRIQNVLATEQEIILDLCVGAINPNLLSVTISDVDLNVFARSKHVGTSSDASAEADASELKQQFQPSYRQRGSYPRSSNVYFRGRAKVKDRYVRATNVEPDYQTMLLGRVFQFDQALVFENTMFSRRRTYSLAELSLLKPGNRTEMGGSARWERVLHYPFELIVRGTLRYRLPVFMRVESVAVESSIVVHPEEAYDGIDVTY